MKVRYYERFQQPPLSSHSTYLIHARTGPLGRMNSLNCSLCFPRDKSTAEIFILLGILRLCLLATMFIKTVYSILMPQNALCLFTTSRCEGFWLHQEDIVISLIITVLVLLYSKYEIFLQVDLFWNVNFCTGSLQKNNNNWIFQPLMPMKNILIYCYI